MPLAITPIVPVASDPWCAAVSSPRASPDHRDAGAREQSGVAPDRHHRGRIVELGEQWRIIGVVDEQIARAKRLDPGDLAFDHRALGDAGRLAAAARGEIGQSLDRALGTAEPCKQLAIGDGADRRRTDQPQPRDAGISHPS